MSNCLILCENNLLMIRNNGHNGYLIQPGESPYETCVREIKEETGLTIKPKLVGIGISIFEERKTEYGFTYYDCVPEKKVIPSSEGELVWVNINEIKHRKDIYEHDKEIYERYFKAKGLLIIELEIKFKNTKRNVSIRSIKELPNNQSIHSELG
ncbi:MAG: hypothetical protein COA79_16545 [Planctomycetota bacterium]|nr:MAG: hypothetical protein COA79_16545 [Planctomycetota bacterium]